MWIKNTLVVFPLTLIAILFLTVVFVPAADSVSDDPARLEKHILALPGDPQQMNPWLSTNATDSDVFKFVMERLLASDADYVLAPHLAKVVRLGEEVVVALMPDDDLGQLREVLQPALEARYGVNFVGFRDYAPRDYDGWDQRGYVNDKRQSLPPKPVIVDHLVMRFEPDPNGSYGALDLPKFTLPDVEEFLLPLLRETLGESRFGGPEGTYNPTQVAAEWFARKYGIALPELALEAEPTPARIEELDKLLNGLVAESAASKLAVTFKEVLENMPEKAIAEHPVVMMRLHEGIRWHDYGEIIHPIRPNGQLRFVAEVEASAGSYTGPLPVRLATNADWDNYRAATKLKLTFDDGGSEVVDNDGQRYRQETLDSGDIAASFSFGRDPKVAAPRGQYAMEIRQLRLFDELNFEVLYNRRFSPALYHLSYAYIIPEHKFTREEWIRQCVAKGRGPSVPNDPNFDYMRALPPSQLEFSRDPIGTGPMKLKHLNGRLLPRWRSGEVVVLERFDDYWRTGWKPLFKELELLVLDNDMGSEASEVTFRSGGMDRFGIRPHQVKHYEKLRDQYHIVKTVRLNYEYLAFNTDEKPFDELKVRQALTMGVNVDDIIKYINYDQGIRVTGPGYPTLPYFDLDYVPNYTFRQGPHKGKTLREAGFKTWPYDIEEAKALLDEAGWKPGPNGVRTKNGEALSFSGTVSGLLDPRSKAFNLARENWKELGCEVELKMFEWNVYINEHILPRKFEMTPLGWLDGIDYDKSQIWHSRYLAPKGMNFSSYRNSEADALMDKLVETYDNEEILRLSRELFRMIADDCPYIFMFTSVANVAYPRNMKWAKPVTDEYGFLIPDANGKPQYEMRSIVDPELMKWRDGHRFFTLQMVRDKTPTPRNDKAELVEVGNLATTWEDFEEAKPETSDGK